MNALVEKAEAPGPLPGHIGLKLRPPTALWWEEHSAQGDAVSLCPKAGQLSSWALCDDADLPAWVAGAVLDEQHAPQVVSVWSSPSQKILPGVCL